MPSLTRRNDRWEFIGGYNDRLIPKDAGFRWDGIQKIWYTLDVVIAKKLSRFADVSVQGYFHAMQQAAVASRSMTPTSHLTVPAPAGLSYLPYQLAAVEYARTRENILLADEMGLGKTIETIAILNDTQDKWENCLILCPASLKYNWESELHKWLVLRHPVTVINGRNTLVKQEFGGITIVNYDLLVGEGATAESIAKIPWSVIVYDECHALKNPKAKRTKAALTIKAGRRIALTGTPIPNKVIDIFCILSTLAPKEFGRNRHKFACHYTKAHMNPWGGWEYEGGRNLDELQERMRAAVMLRRLKSEVLKSLPPKRRQVISIQPDGGKIQKLVELERNWGVESARGHDIPFDEMSKYRHELGIAKIPHAIELINDLLDGGIERLVVYCHHTQVIEGLKTAFDDAFVISGETPLPTRSERVNAWNAGHGRLFLLQTKAGGVGLNMQKSGCTDGLFVEPEWNPSDCEQAEDRIHRLGVSGPVLIRYLVWRDAFEESMAMKLREKSDLAYQALDKQ